jgi:hypothetical protein
MMENLKPDPRVSHFSSEGIQGVLDRLRDIISDPNSTDEDTKNARKALQFFGKNEETPGERVARIQQTRSPR